MLQNMLILSMLMNTRTNNSSGEHYTVRQGDTMWKIAQMYQITLAELIAANPQIENPDLIYPNQRINIPGAATTPGTTTPGTTTPGTTTPGTTTPGTTTPGTTTPGTSENGIETEVVRLINEERSARGLQPLTINSQVADIARLKSEDMAVNNYFSHTSPTYGSPFEMLSNFGVSYRAAAENIAQGQTTAQNVVQSWMNSSGHRENILNSDYTETGVGFAENGGRPIWTQMFIRP